MTATTYELEVTWPITSPDMPLDQLKTQARHDLRVTLARHRLQRAGNTILAVTHGHQPTLTARLIVTGPPGLAGPIEATPAQGVAV